MEQLAEDRLDFCPSTAPMRRRKRNDAARRGRAASLCREAVRLDYYESLSRPDTAGVMGLSLRQAECYRRTAKKHTQKAGRPAG